MYEDDLTCSPLEVSQTLMELSEEHVRRCWPRPSRQAPPTHLVWDLISVV